MLFKIAFRNLCRHFRRTLTLLLTLALGVGALFLYHGFNTGVLRQYKQSIIHAKTGHGQFNTKGYLNEIYSKPHKHWIENSDELIAKLKSYPEVDKVFPRTSFYAVLANGSISVSGRGTAVDGDAEADFFTSVNIVEGETLRGQEDGVLLGIGMARALKAKPGTILTLMGQTVQGRASAVDVTVIGIAHTGVKEADDSSFRIQRKKAANLLDDQGVEAVGVGLKHDDDWDSFAKRARADFPQFDLNAFDELDKVNYQNAVSWLSRQFAVIQIIILFIVTMGITNSFAFAVMERTAEIGNLRANGCSTYSILKLLLCEGFMVGLGGSLLGLASAWLINKVLLRDGISMPPAPGLTRSFAIDLYLEPQMGVTATVLGVIAACIATLIASHKRVRMPIAEALRSRS